MRRLLRWAFNVAVVVSAVLCVAAVVLWVCSYRHVFLAGRERREGLGYVYYRLHIYNGHLMFTASKGNWLPNAQTLWFYNTLRQGNGLTFSDVVPSLDWGGTYFEFTAGGSNSIGGPFVSGTSGPPFPERDTIYLFGVPLWFLALLATILPIRWVISARHRSIQGRESLCPTCGYDLRATPARCPECGAIPKQIRKGIA
jgi:hypothetical protein